MDDMPSMTGGAGGSAGPSQAQGSFFTSLGGMDGSGWDVNFGDNNNPASTIKASSPSVATPVQVGNVANAYGLPTTVVATTNPQASGIAASSSLPLMLIGIALVTVLALHRHG